MQTNASRPAGLDPARKGVDTSLADALRMLDMDGEIAPGGRWVTLRGERFLVYVSQAATGEYFTWCDDPTERSVEAFSDPREAIRAGLRRAARKENGTEEPSSDDRPSWAPRTVPSEGEEQDS